MNPIRGSELYQDDGAIKALIEELRALKVEYAEMVQAIKRDAGKLKKSIDDGSTAQAANTRVQEENAKAAEKLARQYVRYQQSLTDAGKEQVRLSALQRQRNQLVKAEIRLSNSAVGSYDRLSAQYSLNKIKLNAMSAEQRAATKSGRDLERQTKDIYEEMKRLQEATGKTSLSVGDYKTSITDAFSSIASGALGPAAIGAALAAGTAQAVSYVAQTTEEVRKLRGEIQTLTGTSGEQLDGFTARIKGIGDTFGEENSQILEAANAVANQLDISFDDALKNIEEGFVAGSNINGEFLDSLKEYPTFFKEAGLGADSLFRVINQSVKEGIYSDKGIDAIKEATLNLREQPQAAKDALTAIGLTSQQVGGAIENDGIGAAIALVSEQLGTLESDSPQVGEAIAGIFGGAGEDAGLSFLLSLKDINGETGSLIDTTNEYQNQQQLLLEANQDLAAAQTEVLDALGGTGASLELVKAQGEGLLFRAMLPLIEAVKILWQATEPLRDGLNEVFRAMGLTSNGGTILEGVLNLIVIAARVVAVPIRAFSNIMGFLYDRIAGVIDVGRSFLEFLGIVGDEQDTVAESAQNMGRGNRAAREELAKLNEEERKASASKSDARKKTDELTGSLSGLTDQTKKAQKETEELADGSLAKLQKATADLRKELQNASEDDQLGIVVKLIEAEDAQLQAKKYIDGVTERIRQQALNPDTVIPLNVTFGVDELKVDDGFEAALQEKVAGQKINAPIEPAKDDGEKDIFDLLGFDVSDEKKEAIGSAFNFAKNQVLELANLRTQLAAQEVQRADTEVSSAEAALQAEITRNEQGLSSNVEARRRDLADAQQTQEKAREEQQKAQRAERRLQAVQQAANLVTASAKIFAQLGFPAAIPAIGLMFGTFVATKVRAARLARQQNRQGTYQVLRGGSSHESGRDISVGINDGVEHTAERGEGFAVIPSKAVSRYGKVLPGLMRAISGGQLGQWVESQSEANENTLKVVHGPGMGVSDNSAMEEGINQVAKNTSKRVYTDNQGRTVIEDGYNRTIIRA